MDTILYDLKRLRISSAFVQLANMLVRRSNMKEWDTYPQKYFKLIY